MRINTHQFESLSCFLFRKKSPCVIQVITVIVLSDFFQIEYSEKVPITYRISPSINLHAILGGSNGNFFRADSQSNTDQITLHSSRFRLNGTTIFLTKSSFFRLLNPSSSYRSDDDDQSSITNEHNEIHHFRT